MEAYFLDKLEKLSRGVIYRSRVWQIVINKISTPQLHFGH